MVALIHSDGREMPEPVGANQFSGKFVLALNWQVTMSCAQSSSCGRKPEYVLHQGIGKGMKWLLIPR
jgi:hypothetical protein